MSKSWLDYVAVWVALFAAIGSLLGAAASWYQFKASRDQLLAMKFDQRPWISLDLTPSGPLDRDVNGWGYTLGYTMVNVGRSPAFNVNFTANMIPLADAVDVPPAGNGFAFPEPTAAIRRKVDEMCAAGNDARSQGMGEIIFPSVSVTRRWRATSPTPEGGYVPGFAVVACLTYQFSGDTSVHRTVRVFDLTRVQYGEMIHLAVENDAPQQLTFFPHPIEGFTAD